MTSSDVSPLRVQHCMVAFLETHFQRLRQVRGVGQCCLCLTSWLRWNRRIWIMSSNFRVSQFTLWLQSQRKMLPCWTHLQDEISQWKCCKQVCCFNWLLTQMFHAQDDNPHSYKTSLTSVVLILSVCAWIDSQRIRHMVPQIDFPSHQQLYILEEAQYDKQLLMPSVQKWVGVKFLLNFSLSLSLFQNFFPSFFCYITASAWLYSTSLARYNADSPAPCITWSDYPVGIRSCGGNCRNAWTGIRAGMATDGVWRSFVEHIV